VQMCGNQALSKLHTGLLAEFNEPNSCIELRSRMWWTLASNQLSTGAERATGMVQNQHRITPDNELKNHTTSGLHEVSSGNK
jgi:hypothetical protein